MRRNRLSRMRGLNSSRMFTGHNQEAYEELKRKVDLLYSQFEDFKRSIEESYRTGDVQQTFEDIGFAMNEIRYEAKQIEKEAEEALRDCDIPDDEF